jgi:hypothetical protein
VSEEIKWSCKNRAHVDVDKEKLESFKFHFQEFCLLMFRIEFTSPEGNTHSMKSSKFKNHAWKWENILWRLGFALHEEFPNYGSSRAP